MKNKIIIAAAGSGKTYHLIEESMKVKDERVLITTYTENNADEIRSHFFRKYNYIPSHVTIQTWFSFLIQHGVKPYQGTFNNSLFDVSIKGMIFVDDNQGKYPQKKGKNFFYSFKKEETHFIEHYFSDKFKIYSDRLPKFVFKSNKASNGEVFNRISRIYKHIFIDEVQDLAGYDLEIIKLLFESDSNILLVGDPRQVVYLTNHYPKHGKYKNGKIEDFIKKECDKNFYKIDKTTLNKSHRNNKAICDFSSKLYPHFETVSPCNCCRNNEIESEGIFLVRPENVGTYLEEFNPIQLRWDAKIETNKKYQTFNFGESKGKTFERVIIYPTKDMKKWIFDHESELKYGTRAKFYVAITRAKHSVAIISDFSDDIVLDNVQLYKVHNLPTQINPLPLLF